MVHGRSLARLGRILKWATAEGSFTVRLITIDDSRVNTLTLKIIARNLMRYLALFHGKSLLSVSNGPGRMEKAYQEQLLSLT